MATGFPRHRPTALLLAAAACLASAYEYGTQQYIAAENVANVSRNEITLGAVVDSSGLVRRAYDVFFTRLNRKGGLTVGGITYRVILASVNPRSRNGTIEEVEGAARILISGTRRVLLGSGIAAWDEVIARVCHESGALFLAPLLVPSYAVRDHPTVFGLGTASDRLLGGAMQLLAGAIETLAAEGQGAPGALHVLAEDDAWAQEACAAAGSSGIPIATNITVGADAPSVELRAALRNESLQSSGTADVFVACISSRPMCRRLVDSMVELDYDVDAMVVTNCIEADMPFDVNWQPPWNSWVVGVDSWTPNLTESTTVTRLWDAGAFAEAYNRRYSTYLVRKEYSAGLNAAWLLARAFEAADSLEVPELAAWLSSMSEDTDHGSFSFDASGQLEGQRALTKQFVKPNQYAVLIDGAAGAGASAGAATLKYPKPEWQMVDCIGDLAAHRGVYRNESTGGASCTKCPVSMATNYSEEDDIRYCEFCKEGSYPYYDNATVHCVVCREGSFNADREAQQCERCAPGTYQDEQEQTSCKTCPTGTYTATSGQSECLPCPEQTYSKGDDRSTCEPCPDAALCANGMITNKATYYLLNTDGDEITASDFFKCVHSRTETGVRGEACQENGTCWRDDDGEETMTGVLCGSCRKGYGREGITGICQKCGSAFLMWFYALLDPIFWGLVANGFVLIVLYTDFLKPKNTWNIIAKQVLSYLHMLSVSAPYLSIHEEVGFSGFVRRIIWVEQYVGIDAPLIALRGGNCFFATLLPRSKFYQVMVLSAYAYLPVVLTCTYQVFLVAKLLGKPIGGDHGPIYNNPKFITVSVVYMFFLHHKTSKMFISVFQCRSFDNKSRLLLDLEVECLGEEHSSWAIAAGAGLFLYSIGIPLLFFCMLSYHHSKKTLDERGVKQKLGFLYAGYERRVYWFESVLMLRKIIFPILLAVALSTADDGLELSPEATVEKQEEVFNTIPLMVLVLVSLFFFGLHLVFQPYDNRCYFLLDHIETASLWAILLTVTLQVFLTVVGELVDPVRNALFAILVMAHLFFWALVFWGFFRDRIMLMMKDYVLPHLPADLVHKYCSWFFGGRVVVEEDYLDIKELKGAEREYFASLIQEIADKHFETFNRLSFYGIMGTLQCMCIQAAHNKKHEAGRTQDAFSELAAVGRAVSSTNLRGALRAATTPGGDYRAGFSRAAWRNVVQRKFTVEALEMAWLNLASLNWNEEVDEAWHAEQGTLALGHALQKGIPLGAHHDDTPEISRSSRPDAGSPDTSRSTAKMRSIQDLYPPTPKDVHEEVQSRGLLPQSDSSPTAGDGGSQGEELPDEGGGRARQEREEMTVQLAKLEAENKKLHGDLHAMMKAKDALKIGIRSAQGLAPDNTYYVSACIRGKEYAGKSNTQAVLLKPAFGADVKWNHEGFLHGYEEGDGLRFVVWAWGKQRQAHVKVGSVDLSAEEVASTLAARDQSLKAKLQLEGAPRGRGPSLQVQVLSRFQQREEEEEEAPNSPSDWVAALGNRKESEAAEERAARGASARSPHDDGVRGFTVLPEHGLEIFSVPNKMGLVQAFREAGEIVYGTFLPSAKEDPFGDQWLRLEHDLGYILRRQEGEPTLGELFSEEHGPESEALWAEMANMSDIPDHMMEIPDHMMEIPDNAEIASQQPGPILRNSSDESHG